MPLIRYVYNKTGNHAQDLTWGQNSFCYEGAVLKYADVRSVSFSFSHSANYVNMVKNDDTLSYEVRINDLVIKRRHSAFNRVSSKSKAIVREIEEEYQGIVENIYRYIVPGLFQRKAEEMLVNGSVDIAGITFESAGSIVYKGTRHKASDLAVSGWTITDNGMRTVFGNAKTVTRVDASQSNGILVEPMIRLIQRM